MEKLLLRSVKITAVLMLITSVVLAMFRQWLWLSGFIVGNSWSILNFLLLAKLFKMAIQKKPKHKIFLILLLKFPVLYLAGFFILVTKFFPVWSLFCGLMTIIAVTVTVSLKASAKL